MIQSLIHLCHVVAGVLQALNEKFGVFIGFGVDWLQQLKQAILDVAIKQQLKALASGQDLWVMLTDTAEDEYDQRLEDRCALNLHATSD